MQEEQEQRKTVGEVLERGSRPEKGFVFIREAGNTKGPNLFAHINSFPRAYRGEAFYDVVRKAVCFNIEVGLDGRRRAVRIEVLDDEDVSGEVA